MDTNGTSSPVRWGIASTGRIAASMAEALDDVAGAELVAVGSRTQESADTFADRFGVPRAHGSLADLYADDDVDVVYVASPHSHHRDMTIDALNAGRHVLCEKAFAVNAAQAREMVAAARANDRFLMEAMWTWFIPAVEEVRRQVLDGYIGEIVLVEANFGITVLDEDGRHRRPDLAGGSLLDLGIYPLAIARYLLGEPVETRAVASLTAQGVDATLAGSARFSSGALATFTSSLDATTTGDARITGTVGSIVIEAPFWHTSAFRITVGGVTERVEIPSQGLAHEAAHVVDCIRRGARESDVLPLATTIANMELMDDVRRQIGVVYPEEASDGR